LWLAYGQLRTRPRRPRKRGRASLPSVFFFFSSSSSSRLFQPGSDVIFLSSPAEGRKPGGLKGRGGYSGLRLFPFFNLPLLLVIVVRKKRKFFPVIHSEERPSLRGKVALKPSPLLRHTLCLFPQWPVAISGRQTRHLVERKKGALPDIDPAFKRRIKYLPREAAAGRGCARLRRNAVPIVTALESALPSFLLLLPLLFSLLLLSWLEIKEGKWPSFRQYFLSVQVSVCGHSHYFRWRNLR
jgi:hypothetical protein